MTYKLVKWGAFLCEICTLLMLYSATLLAPIPFGFARISGILFMAAASFTFAYFASLNSKSIAEAKRSSFRQVLLKPPSIIWIAAVVIIGLQLVSALTMVYLSHKK